MARQRRISEPGTYHHITARGVDRCDVFVDDNDRRQFLALVSESSERFGCRVLAFCLMTNHIHLTVRDDRGTLSKTLHLLNGVYAKRFNHKHNRTGHLFERRFWSSAIDSEAYLTQCVAYVHRNPLEAGLVNRLGDYPWSSYPSYLGLRSSPHFLDTAIVLDHYGSDRARMRADTEAHAGDSLLVRQLQSTNPPAVLSDSTTEMNRRTVLRHVEPPTLTIEEVVVACASVCAVPVTTVTTREQGRHNPARGLAAYVAHRHAGFPLKEIAVALDSRPSAVRLHTEGLLRRPPPKHNGNGSPQFCNA